MGHTWTEVSFQPTWSFLGVPQCLSTNRTRIAPWLTSCDAQGMASWPVPWTRISICPTLQISVVIPAQQQQRLSRDGPKTMVSRYRNLLKFSQDTRLETNVLYALQLFRLVWRSFML